MSDEVADACGVVIDSACRLTRQLATRGELCRGIPDSTLNVILPDVVREVVAVGDDVVVVTRIRDQAAELPNCN